MSSESGSPPLRPPMGGAGARPRAARRIVAIATTVAIGVAAAGAIAWHRFMPSDAEMAGHLGDALSERLGLAVTVGALEWRLRPWPSIELRDVRTRQAAPIVLDRVQLDPDLRLLVTDRLLSFTRVRIDGGALPQRSLRALRPAAAASAAVSPPEGAASAPERGVVSRWAAAGGPWRLAPVPVTRLDFAAVTWITRHGVRLLFEGGASFEADWRPREATLVRPGAAVPATLTLVREAGADRWRVRVALGGGTADGEASLDEAPDGGLRLAGRLAPRGVEIASALAAFGRDSALEGRARGETELTGQGATIGELARSLRTTTRFSIAPATLLRIDVDRAIRSFGTDRAGTTALAEVSGRLDTQNTENGIVTRLVAIRARGQNFTAGGEGTVANRRIDGRVTIDVAGGLVGVPLEIAGPLAKPEVRLRVPAVASRAGGAAAGAAIGTAVLPGIGTAVGAGIGAMAGRLFGHDGPATEDAAPRPRR